MDYNKSGLTTTTDECSDNKCFGHSKSQSGGGLNVETSGNTGGASGKTVAFVVMGDCNIKCENAYVGANKNLGMNIGGDASLKVKGDFNTDVEGNQTTKVKKTMTLIASEKIDLNPSSGGSGVA